MLEVETEMDQLPTYLTEAAVAVSWARVASGCMW